MMRIFTNYKYLEWIRTVMLIIEGILIPIWILSAGAVLSTTVLIIFSVIMLLYISIVTVVVNKTRSFILDNELVKLMLAVQYKEAINFLINTEQYDFDNLSEAIWYLAEEHVRQYYKRYCSTNNKKFSEYFYRLMISFLECTSRENVESFALIAVDYDDNVIRDMIKSQKLNKEILERTYKI